MKRAWLIVLLLAVIVAIPLLMRRETEMVSPDRADDRLIIISPHNESIRREFAEAFARWWKERTGRTIYVDWRTPGGASEIRMVLDAGYQAAQESGREGVGMDVYFGGGEPDFSRQAREGRLVPLAVFTQHPEWFGPSAPIPPTHTGETYFPADHVWVGTCLSQFGIAYNRDVLDRLKMPVPRRWDDLGDPRLSGALALADPTKSGSVARAFELLVQGQMQRAIADHTLPAPEAAARGWEGGLRLILRLGANARYYTDSASKIPHDIGQGDAAAGMCIDFYGRSYHEALLRPDGSSRVDWIGPQGGGTYSADPIAVLKGAPHPQIAQDFVTFCLSPEGQRLWFGKPGTPGGPRARALHRLPIRADLYTPQIMADATLTIDPYTDTGAYIYQRELTGRAFKTIANFVRIACIDSHQELRAAWEAMRAAGFPADAMAAFSDVSAFSYQATGQGDAVLDGPDALLAAQRSTQLGQQFRANFRRARALAEAHLSATHTGGK